MTWIDNQNGVNKMFRKIFIAINTFLILLICGQSYAATTIRGIYINQGTAENSALLSQIIRDGKAVGINTLVVDIEKPTPALQKNMKIVKSNGMRYVARLVVFPDGGRAVHVKNPAYWEKRLKLAETAIGYGADEIQLDYIRYSSKVPPSPQNAKDVKQVIKYFKQKIAAHNIPMQIDIFGEVSFKESPRIGQNIQLFADTIDAACPMVYPSHYAPYQTHSKQPYQTVYKSLTALKKQFDNNKPPFKLIAYVEASNYHYKWSSAQKSAYVLSQIKAAEDANADGWYVWSPQNVYASLFAGLKNRADYKINESPAVEEKAKEKDKDKDKDKNKEEIKADAKTPQPQKVSNKSSINAKSWAAHLKTRSQTAVPKTL